MPIKHFTELQCWQLANQLRQEVLAICAKPEVMRDGRFCDDFRAAAGSVCRNISEGFERFLGAEIVRFFRYALGSLGEVQDDLCECTARRVIDQAQFDRLWDLSEHTKATALKFMKSHQKDQGTRSGRPNRKHVARRT